jgi:threonine dehydratase
MITFADIEAAAARLDGTAAHTPLLRARPERGSAIAVFYKPETLQPIGSFKLRGAFNRIAALPAAERVNGVIAYSSGNHAQGVAYAAQTLGIPATIIMPSNAPSVKLKATRGYGAEVVLYDPHTEKREEVTAQWMHDHGGPPRTLVPPYNDLLVIAGQGTIGLEIGRDMPGVDLVIGPVGGGGLISGAAVALKTINRQVRIIGVEPTLANDAQQSLRTGHIIELSASQANRTIADGVRTLALGPLTFEHMHALVDDILTVSEDEIRAAARQLILDEKLVVEPTGALALAAWNAHRAALMAAYQPRSVVLILSGGNIEPEMLAALVTS